MKTFIVPTDFSDVAKNAALFAAELAASVPESRVILYHVYPEVYAGSDSSPLADDSNARKTIFNTALASIKSDMAAGNASVITLSEANNSFPDALQNLVLHERADMIVMGITGTSTLDTLIGSNTLGIIKRNLCPVMIVPPQATYTQVKNVMLATDLKDIDSTTPFKYLKAVLDLFRAKLHIVNVSADPSSITEESESEKMKLETQFNSYNPQFYFIKDGDVVDTLNQFALDNNIDLILTVPRKHALSGLFQTSHTKKLAYHTNVPLVAVHE